MSEYSGTYRTRWEVCCQPGPPDSDGEPHWFPFGVHPLTGEVMWRRPVEAPKKRPSEPKKGKGKDESETATPRPSKGGWG